jgi:hypothetical protein
MAKWRIIKNKKGILGISLDSIGSWIQGITSILPTPVKFLLFLFLLVTLTYILSIVFHAFGIFCNSAEQPVQINPNLFTSISLIGQIPDIKDIGKEQIDPYTIPVLSQVEQAQECSNLETSGSYILMDDDANLFLANLGMFRQGQRFNITKPTWFYLASNTHATICTNIRVEETSGLASHYNACLGDVYRKTEAEKTWSQKVFAGCEPPLHYYFESTTGKYLCSDNSCTGQTLGKTWDELLNTKGAKLMYSNTRNIRNPSGDNAIGITCSDLRPRMAIYGIDLFTYSTWLVITLIVILLWAFNEIRK